MKKRGQLKLSFGMIFSIILIIIFIAFAFYVIPKILDFQRTAQIGMFIDDLENDIDRIWQDVQSQESKIYNLPKKVEYVCFDEDSKLSFKPLGSGKGFDNKKIEHINIDEMIIVEYPFCVENKGGEINIIIKKDFGDALVTIEKNE